MGPRFHAHEVPFPIGEDRGFPIPLAWPYLQQFLDRLGGDVRQRESPGNPGLGVLGPDRVLPSAVVEVRRQKGKGFQRTDAGIQVEEEQGIVPHAGVGGEFRQGEQFLQDFGCDVHDPGGFLPLLEVRQGVGRYDLLVDKPGEEALEVGKADVVGGGAFRFREEVHEVHLEVGAVPGEGIPFEEEIHCAVVVLQGAGASTLGSFEGEELLEQFLPGGGLVGTERDDLGSSHDIGPPFQENRHSRRGEERPRMPAIDLIIYI